MLQSYEALQQGKESSARGSRRQETGVKSVLVLGMHRSGASAVTSALSAMGLYVGAEHELTGGTREDSRDFLERRDMRLICDDLLHRSGADWWKLSDFAPDAISSEVVGNNLEAIRTLTEELDSQGNWVLKDPRLCLLLPLFRQVREASLAICVVRDPVEVAQSLKKLHGIPLHAGFALWEFYNRSMVRHVKDLNRVVVNYNRLVEDPSAEVGAVVRALWNAGIEGVDPRAGEAAVEPSLHRERDDGSGYPVLLRPNQKRLWNALSAGRLDRLSTAPSRAAILTLREYEADVADSPKHNGNVRNGYDGFPRDAWKPGQTDAERAEGSSTTSHEHGSVVANLEEFVRRQDATADEARRHFRTVGDNDAGSEDLRRPIDGRDNVLDGGEEQAAEAHGGAREQEDRLRELGSELSRRDELLAELRSELDRRQSLLDERAAALAQKEELLRDFEQTVSDRDDQLERVRAQLEQRDELVAALKADISDRQAALGDRDSRLEEAETELVARDEQFADVRAQVASRDELIADLRGDLAQRAKELEARESEIASRDERVRELDTALSEQAEQIRSLQASVGERDQQLEQLQARLTESDGELTARARVIGKRDAQLAKKDAALEDLKAAFAREQDRARALAADLADREELTAHLREDGAEQRRMLEARRAELERLDERAQELEDALTSRDEQLAERAKSLRAKEEELSALKDQYEAEAEQRASVEEQLESRVQEVVDLSQSLIQARDYRQEREQELVELRTELKAERERVEEQQAGFRFRGQEIDRLQALLADHTEGVQQRDEQIERLQLGIARHAEAIRALERRFEDEQDFTDALLSSRSWRLTKPLRVTAALGKLVRYYARRLDPVRGPALVLRRSFGRRG